MKKKEPSISQIYASVPVKMSSSFLRRLLTFTGPAFMVAVGYIDPGNWATDIAAGSKFGYKLIWIILLANLMAVLFQTLSARLGIVTGRNLAQSCNDYYPKPISFALWILCEIAIVATDLAEIMGSAIGLYLLFGIPLLFGVLITAFDVMLLLALESFGIRKMEAIIVTLIATVGLCFGLEMFLSKPGLLEIASGFLPSPLTGEALYVSIGIIGATVMPHNLYLHSALVQSRAIERSSAGLKDAVKFNLIDSVVALNGAFFINAAILILAAATFYKAGQYSITSIIEAHKFLTPLLGTSIASVVFAIALIASGQSSTITGTYAGQIVMEGFIGIRLRPWLRRLITRLLAIIPAVVAIQMFGNSGVDNLLVLSQVILSLQLPFALVPLLHFTGDREKMGEFFSKSWLKILAWISAILVIALNLQLILTVARENLAPGGTSPSLVKYLLIPFTLLLIPLLFWMIFEPLLRKKPVLKAKEVVAPLLALTKYEGYKPLRTIGLALEVHNVERDKQILANALPMAHLFNAELVLIHIVESAAGRFIGKSAYDDEVKTDAEYLEQIALEIKNSGIPSKVIMGAGDPSHEIARIAEENNVDMIILGSHGHKGLSDLIHGSTLEELKNKTRIQVLAIPIKD